MTTRSAKGNHTLVSLSRLGEAIDLALDQRDLERAREIIYLILAQRPRHLPTYRRVLAVTWVLDGWEECADWARRLLNGDPLSGAGWAAVARSLEEGQKSPSEQIYAAWQRAFELDPYNELIRAGVVRSQGITATGEQAQTQRLELNHACLASLYLRSRRWHHAGDLYGALSQAAPDRVDFRIGLMLATWQAGERTEAHQLARSLLAGNRNLLAAWLVLADVGDEDDRAMAPGYMDAMDADGEYAVEWLGPRFYRRNGPGARIPLSPEILTQLNLGGQEAGLPQS